MIHVFSATELLFNGKHYRCTIGSNGFTAHHREGDKATPIGIFYLRECWYRPDRISPPQTTLPLREITKQDGWCDAPDHPSYNTHVTLPFAASHELLCRQDHNYDIMVPLGFNDDPVIPGLGSAIFFHIAKPDYTPTLGCIAISLQDMLEIISECDATTQMRIAPLA